MWTLERQLRLPYLQITESQLRKQFMVPKRGMRGGMNWETGIDIYILLYIKQKTNEHLQSSTGDSTHCSVVGDLDGEGIQKRVDICVGKTDSLLYKKTNAILVKQLYSNKIHIN